MSLSSDENVEPSRNERDDAAKEEQCEISKKPAVDEPNPVKGDSPTEKKTVVGEKRSAATAAVAEQSEPSAAASTTTTTASSPKRSRTTSEGEVLDLAETLRLKVGDRLEVQWDVTMPSSSDEGGTPAEVKTRWWGATLREFDGRKEDSVAVRVLDYDPYPEGGYPERSQEDVVFIGTDSLVDLRTQLQLPFRMEGEKSPTVLMDRGEMEEFVNATLMDALKKNTKAWNGLSTAQQAVIAESIAIKKEKLLGLLQQHRGVVITPDDMRSILAQTMEE